MHIVTGLDFKSFDLAEEWEKSGHIDARLRAVNFYIAFYCYIEFNKSWIITQIGRSDQEQIQLYPKYFQKWNKPKDSKHCKKPVRAIDARSYHLLPHEIEELKLVFRKWFKTMNGDETLFKHHKIETSVHHCHVQV